MFLFYEAAQIAFNLKNIDEAVDFAIRAALAPGEIENKIHLWELLKSILFQLKLFDKAIEMATAYCFLSENSNNGLSHKA